MRIAFIIGVSLVSACRVPLDVIDRAPGDAAPGDVAATETGSSCTLAPGQPITLDIYRHADKVPAHLAVGAGQVHLLDAFKGPGSPGSASVYTTNLCPATAMLTKRADVEPYNAGGRPVIAASEDAVFFGRAGTAMSMGDSISVLERSSPRPRELLAGVGSLCALAFDVRRDRLVLARCAEGIDLFDVGSGARKRLVGPRAIAAVPLAFDAETLVWVESRPPKVLQVGWAGGDPVEIYADSVVPAAVALDETYVYIATDMKPGLTGLLRIPRRGGSAERVGMVQTVPFTALARTTTAVFAAGPSGIHRVDGTALIPISSQPVSVMIADTDELFYTVNEPGQALLVRLRP